MAPIILKIKDSPLNQFSYLGTEDDLSATWRVCTKVKDSLENGLRLENLSWRLWFAHTIHHHQNSKNNSSQSDIDLKDPSILDSPSPSMSMSVSSSSPLPSPLPLASSLPFNQTSQQSTATLNSSTSTTQVHTEQELQKIKYHQKQLEYRRTLRLQQQRQQAKILKRLPKSFVPPCQKKISKNTPSLSKVQAPKTNTTKDTTKNIQQSDLTLNFPPPGAKTAKAVSVDISTPVTPYTPSNTPTRTTTTTVAKSTATNINDINRNNNNNSSSNNGSSVIQTPDPHLVTTQCLSLQRFDATHDPIVQLQDIFGSLDEINAFLGYMQKDALNPHEPSSLTTHLPFFSNLNDGPVQTSLQPPPQTLSASEPPNNHNNNNHHHHNQNTLSVTQSAVCSPPDLSFRPSSSHSQTYSLSAPLCSATLPFPLFSPTPVSPLTPSSPTCVSPVGLFINAPSHKSVARRPFINSTPSEGKIPICSNCSTTSTPLWRRSAEDDLLCNACGLYLKLHNAPRPRHLKPQSNNRPGVPENEENLIQTLCTNCRTTTTPLWRRDLKGNPLCNACGLYLKLHNEKRPLSMKTNVIKKRQRCDTGNTTSSSASVSVSVSALSSISSSPPPQKQKQKQKQPTLKNTRQQQQKQSLVSHSLPTSTPSMSTESIASISTPSTPCTTSASASASLSLSSTLSTVPNPNLHSHSHSSHIIIPNIFPAPVEFSPQAYAHQTSPVTQNFSINNHS